MARKLFGCVFVLVSVVVDTSAQSQPRTFFKEQVKLTDSEIQKIEQGAVITKVLDAKDPLGLLVFGAVYINAPITKLAPAFRDVNRLKQNKVYLDVQEFSIVGVPPKESDFARLTLDNKDIDEFRTCKPGDCDLQILDDFETFQKKIDWNSNNRYTQVNQLLRRRAVEGMNAYLKSGLKAFGSYHDRNKPLNLYEATKGMLDRSPYISVSRAPEIYRHIVDYPSGKMPGAEDFFYWEKIDFGQEPTVRINHVSMFPSGHGPVKVVIANKQLYSSRYIRVALQMFYAVPDTEHPEKPGFFLIEMNDSQVPDFGSLKLGVVRRIATGKSVDATRDWLDMFSARLRGK